MKVRVREEVNQTLKIRRSKILFLFICFFFKINSYEIERKMKISKSIFYIVLLCAFIDVVKPSSETIKDKQNKKKKDLVDYTEVEIEKLYDEWEVWIKIFQHFCL